MVAATAMAALAPSVGVAADRGWAAVPTTNPAGANGYNVLNGVAVVSPTDAWAAGYGRVRSPGTVPYRPVLQHWDGTAWHTFVTAFLPAGDDARLTAVTALTTQDAWAVGQRTTAAGQHSLLEHWDGSQWTLVAPPSGDPAGAALDAVSASGPADVWAVGSQTHTVDSSRTPLAEHWDGVHWSVVATPMFSGASHTDLNGVVALDAHHAWIAGATGGQHPVAVLERWDGISWAVAPSPPTRFYSALYSVTARSGADAWAVGFEGVTDPLIEHWDGQAWTIVPSALPPGSSTSSVLSGVTAFSASDAWAVGQVLSLGAFRSPVTEHWDGRRWAIVSTPKASPSELSAVAGTSGGTLWAVGSRQTSAGATVTVAMRTTA